MALNVSSHGDVRPVLGLTTYLQQAQTGVWDVQASFLPAIYVEGVTLAGGIAMLLPPQPVDDAVVDRVLDGLDHDDVAEVDTRAAHIRELILTQAVPDDVRDDTIAAYDALKRADYAGWLSAELMMFGANPVPPTPLELLQRTREHTQWAWGS